MTMVKAQMKHFLRHLTEHQKTALIKLREYKNKTGHNIR